MPQVPPVAPAAASGLDPQVETHAHRRSLLFRYARSGHTEVEGWLLQPAVDALLCIIGEQARGQLRGPACEIGVHHGRLFILLCLATVHGERAVAYDLFARQDENVDGSGSGSLERLLENARRHHCDPEALEAITINSRDLDGGRVIRDCGARPRLFSIDGGHTAEQTRHDLETAAAAMCAGGIIILDDLFNEAWPGVAEGTCRFMFSHPGALLPVAIAGNKLFLTNEGQWAARYRSAVADPGWQYCLKISQMFGHDVVVVREESAPLRRVRRFVGHNLPWLRRFVRRVRAFIAGRRR